MPKLRLHVFAVLAALALVFVLGASAGTRAASAGPEFEDGVVLVGFTPGTSAAQRSEIVRAAGASQQAVVGAGTHVLRIAPGTVQAQIAQLRQNPNVRYAEPNYIVRADVTPNDPSFGQLWGLQNTGQSVNGTIGTAGADISAPAAWGVDTGSGSIVVGVVDTGIDYNHPDLAANVWVNPGGIGGCAAGTHGFNAVANTCDPLDDNDHGSHTSGTIGAVGNNGVGVAGINWKVQLMGLKFLNSAGSGTTAGAISAIDFAVQAKIAGVNVRALNNSWGGGGFSQALLDEINKAGANDILFVAAAGNNGANNDNVAFYPASYGAANEIAVAATDQNDSKASFSNYGPTSVQLGAPGTNILSTTRNNTYAYFNGTSMATPHVTGAAALVLSHCTLSTAGVKAAILNNVDPLASLAGLVATGGRLNLFKAVTSCTPPPPPGPDFTIAAAPGSASTGQGGTTSYTVTVGAQNGFVGNVALSVSGLPTDATWTFTPTSIASSGTSTLSVTAGTTTGSFPLTITGTSGTTSHTASVTLVVNPPGDFGLAIVPSSITNQHAKSTTARVDVTSIGGFNGVVSLSVSGAPPGTTVTLSPSSVAAPGSATMTISSAGNARRGTVTITVTGSSGSASHTATASLTIR